ncbi:hypothetical protein CSKR_110881 [Clonorchis sinensis]|uniref:Uncharacterized protein n=1 Tax=Clonorchis sinensis TaxID=79923 RepID=A0A419QAT3_CLOSI|nr:hypothetical protein CSKR_110881 [Clonorchis sinensis]
MSIITTVDSMTSVFNTGASLPYNSDLFESLILKKRTKKLTTRTPLTSISSHILQCLQPATLGITKSPSWKVSKTDSIQTFRNPFHTPQPTQTLGTCLLLSLWIGHGKQNSLANDGLAYAIHGLANAASGAGYILQWKFWLHNGKLAFKLPHYGFARANPHELWS